MRLDCISGDITFYRKVSSEGSCDYLKFYIDGVEKGTWSGTRDWDQVSFSVTPGTRTFEWTYSKDGSVSEDDDTAWIDDIVFPTGADTDAVAPGLLSDPELTLYYSFDEVTDIVLDQSGNGHDGVVIGDVTLDPEGMRNGAAKFATGSYLDLDGPSIPSEHIPTTGITLAAWVKCEYTGGHHAIFNARAADATWLIHPELRSNDEFRWLLRTAGGNTIFDIRTGEVTWDEWLHFCGMYDQASGRAALYIDGELIQEQTVPTRLKIARDWGSGARVGRNIDNLRPFTGLMDMLWLFRRSLSEGEIPQAMQGGIPL